MFAVPTFAPRPLEQLPCELDEVSLLVKQENALADEVGADWGLVLGQACMLSPQRAAGDARVLAEPAAEGCCTCSDLAAAASG